MLGDRVSARAPNLRAASPGPSVVKAATGPVGVGPETSLRLTSDRVGIPAELKHINKRRKRNQQGLPQ